MDVDPTHALAFSMQARRGLYALLLGSGVSTAAGIPTGWDVVLDLIGKLAKLQGEQPADRYKWYVDKHGSDPNYSDLIEQVARTPAERQQILRQYWEADPADAPDAVRRPTAAHVAIADLVKNGFVKVIVTTNFDHLIENALRDAGVEPAVLSSPEDVIGAAPLDHTSCCVLKLHGDYLDERIRNTADELSEYPPVLNDLLDRIFEDYGLVVCGWSGDWDVALGKAIRRAKSRRYTTYWTVYRELGEEARRIAKARDARVLEISGADGFFGDLCSLVRSLEDHAQSHPMSIKATVAQCKHFLSHHQYRIRLADLIDSIGKEAVDGMTSPPSPWTSDNGALTARMREYEGTCSKLLATAVVASFWSDVTQISAWEKTVESVFLTAPDVGSDMSKAVTCYPAVLLTYALAMGAVAADRLDNLYRILTFPTGRDAEPRRRGMGVALEDVAGGLHRFARHAVFAKAHLQTLEDMENRHVPMNDWIFGSLRRHMADVTPTDTRYQRTFDRTEILLALHSGVLMEEEEFGPRWLSPVGCFVYRHDNFNAVVREIESSLNAEGEDSPFVRFNIVGSTAADGLTRLKEFYGHVGRVRNELRIY